VLSLSDAEVSLAQGTSKKPFNSRRVRTGAKSGGHVLVCADRPLKELADAEAVECHGLFWILDQIIGAGPLTPKRLRAAPEAIASHPRSRVPKDLIAIYITKLSK
jgi:hypothetical protein